jgi:iron complex outermembrane receptor protein
LAVEWRFWGHRGRLRTAYAYLQTDFDLPPASDPISANAESVAPEHQFCVWSSFDLRSAMHFDAVGRFVGALREQPGIGQGTGLDIAGFFPVRNVDAYFELDLRLAWRPARALEVELVGRNLLAADHAEFVGFFIDTLPTRTQRGVSTGISWKF